MENNIFFYFSSLNLTWNLIDPGSTAHHEHRDGRYVSILLTFLEIKILMIKKESKFKWVLSVMKTLEISLLFTAFEWTVLVFYLRKSVYRYGGAAHRISKYRAKTPLDMQKFTNRNSHIDQLSVASSENKRSFRDTNSFGHQ